jgi:hypothetical protein
MAKKHESTSIKHAGIQPITISEDDGIKTHLRRCLSVPTTLYDLSSIMKCRTLDESLHSNYGSDSGKDDRGIQFDKVIIREYARTVGDNPSCSSGPPVR